MSEPGLQSLKRWIESKTGSGPFGCLIMKEGEIVAKWYGGSFSSESLFEIGSIRKSFTSALIGCCIEEGKVDLQLKANSVWPEIVEISGDAKDSDITLHQLASGTSGWLTPEEPGKKFQYNNAGFTAAERVVARVNGFPRDEIGPEVNRRFKTALKTDSWEVYHFSVGFDPQDCEIPGPKLAINSNLRELVTWGALWLHDGCWKGRQIIPKEWVRKATRPVNPEMASCFYGYNWFINQNRSLWPAAPSDSFGHPGFGTFKDSGKDSRAYLWICPSLQTVAAIITDITAGFANDYLDIPQGVTAEWIGRIAELVAVG